MTFGPLFVQLKVPRVRSFRSVPLGRVGALRGGNPGTRNQRNRACERCADIVESYDPMGYTGSVQTVVETPVFIRRAEKLLDQEEHDELITYLATNPLAGDEIVGTGGVRKVRFAAKGKGKSGGVRVIYYFYDREMPVYALLIYGKNERADLTPDQRKSVASFAAAIKSVRKRK